MEHFIPQFISTFYALVLFVLTVIGIFQLMRYYFEGKHNVDVPHSQIAKIILGMVIIGIGFQMGDLIEAMTTSITLDLNPKSGDGMSSKFFSSLIVVGALFVFINLLSFALAYLGFRVMLGQNKLQEEVSQEKVWTGFLVGAFFIAISLILMSFEGELIEYYHYNVKANTIG